MLICCDGQNAGRRRQKFLFLQECRRTGISRDADGGKDEERFA